MVEQKDYGILLQIIKRCSRIEKKINNISQEAFNQNEDMIEVICFNIFQIGEIANRLSETFTEEYDAIPWKQIRGMRNRIVHGYDTINKSILWETATISIPKLKESCLTITEDQNKIAL